MRPQFPTENSPPADLPTLHLMLPEQLDVLSPGDLAHYADRISRRYQSLRARYEDEGLDTRGEMLELGSHLAMATRALSAQVLP